MLRTAVLLAVGLVLVCVGAVMLVVPHAGPSVHRPTAPDPEVDPARPTTAAPTPSGRAATAHPERSPFRPLRVTFADADGVTASVDPVRTKVDGSLDLPVDPARMGWWTGGSRAGAPYGSVVLAGHLDSRELGIGFSALMSDLDVGERVVLSDRDQRVGYVVSRRYLQPRASVAGLADLFSDRTDARLVLITCGGAYDHTVGAYEDNLVVEAVPDGAPRRAG